MYTVIINKNILQYSAIIDHRLLSHDFIGIELKSQIKRLLSEMLFIKRQKIFLVDKQILNVYATHMQLYCRTLYRRFKRLMLRYVSFSLHHMRSSGYLCLMCLIICHYSLYISDIMMCTFFLDLTISLVCDRLVNLLLYSFLYLSSDIIFSSSRDLQCPIIFLSSLND